MLVAYLWNIKKILVLVVTLLCSGVAGLALAAPAELMPLAEQSLLLDGQVIGARLVVVGERGHILLSDDAGRSWRQQPVPTRATLTSVFFVDERLGWAAGHDAVILRTTDGGESWNKVYDDIAGQRPVLDLWFRDADTGYAIGAYGLLLVTTDGGETWQEKLFATERQDESAVADTSSEDAASWFDDPAALAEDLHLNQLRESASGRLYIAAEAGNVFRSDDGGRTWLLTAPPYEGSFFGLLPLAQESLLAYGLRGNLLFSPDAGETWTTEPTGTNATLNDAIRLQDGRIVVAGMDGILLLSKDQGRTFRAHPQPDRAGLMRVLEAREGRLILIGTHGVRRLTLPSPPLLPRVKREESR